MKESLLKRAKDNLSLLSEQVGPPAVAHMPQTTNQAIVVVFQDLLKVMELLDHELELLMK
jgi:hypothetical protein